MALMMASIIFNWTKVALEVILLSWFFMFASGQTEPPFCSETTTTRSCIGILICFTDVSPPIDVVTPELMVMQTQDNLEMNAAITLSWQDGIEDEILEVLVGESPGGVNCTPNISVSEVDRANHNYTFPPFPAGSRDQDHMYCIRFRNNDGCLSDLVTVQPFLGEENNVTGTTAPTETNTPSTTAVSTPAETSTIDTTNATASDTMFTNTDGSEFPTTDHDETNTTPANARSENFPFPTVRVDENGLPEYAIIVIGVVVVLTICMIILVVIVLSVLVYVYRSKKQKKTRSKKVSINTMYQSSDLTLRDTPNREHSLLPQHYYPVLIQITDPYSKLQHPGPHGKRGTLNDYSTVHDPDKYSKLQQPGSHGNKEITLNGRYSQVEISDSDDRYSKLEQTDTNLGHKGIPLNEEYSQLRNPQSGDSSPSDQLQQPDFPGNKARNPLLESREHMNSWLKTPSSDEHIQLQHPDLELQHLDSPRNKNTHVYTYINLGDRYNHLSPSSSLPTASSVHHYYSEPSDITDRTD